MPIATPLAAAASPQAAWPPLLRHAARWTGTGIRWLDWIAPLVSLAVRLFIATVFFKAGLTKIASWENTVALFEHEYMVPLLPPALAALMATVAELVLPAMLALGLGTRLAAAGLFVLNAVAVISYPGIGEVGLGHHQMWGLFLLVTLTHGPGRLSLDHLIKRRFFRAD